MISWSKADKTIGDNVVMIGYVSDHLTYGYKPLNGNGVVLTSSVPFNWRTSTYSYYAMPIAGDDSDVLITAYMTNRGYVAGQGNRSTWAPSFLVKINNDGTTQVLSKATNQGDWIWDSSSENDKMLAKSIDEAKLTGEAVPTRVPDLSSGSKKDNPIQFLVTNLARAHGLLVLMMLHLNCLNFHFQISQHRLHQTDQKSQPHQIQIIQGNQHQIPLVHQSNH
ncbi:glycoside hydrolase family 68 protein [Limosilactobacillus vaginalis]